MSKQECLLSLIDRNTQTVGTPELGEHVSLSPRMLKSQSDIFNFIQPLICVSMEFLDVIHQIRYLASKVCSH